MTHAATHPFERGPGCMSRCLCGRTFSDPVHGQQPENIVRLRAALAARLQTALDWFDTVQPSRAAVFDMDAYMMAAKELRRVAGDALTLPPDPERLRQAALAHSRAEQRAWAEKGEDGVIHVCGWYNTDCAAAIIAAWETEK